MREHACVKVHGSVDRCKEEKDECLDEISRGYSRSFERRKSLELEYVVSL